MLGADKLAGDDVPPVLVINTCECRLRDCISPNASRYFRPAKILASRGRTEKRVQGRGCVLKFESTFDARDRRGEKSIKATGAREEDSEKYPTCSLKSHLKKFLTWREQTRVVSESGTRTGRR